MSRDCGNPSIEIVYETPPKIPECITALLSDYANRFGYELVYSEPNELGEHLITVRRSYSTLTMVFRSGRLIEMTEHRHQERRPEPDSYYDQRTRKFYSE